LLQLHRTYNRASTALRHVLEQHNAMIFSATRKATLVIHGGVNMFYNFLVPYSY